MKTEKILVGTKEELTEHILKNINYDADKSFATDTFTTRSGIQKQLKNLEKNQWNVGKVFFITQRDENTVELKSELVHIKESINNIHKKEKHISVETQPEEQ